MDAGSFPQRSKDWSQGASFNAPSAVYGPGASFHEGFASMKAIDWSKSSNSGNSFFTQGRVNTQVQILPVYGENDECSDWHRQLYRQYVFGYAPAYERQQLDKEIFQVRDRVGLLEQERGDMDPSGLYGLNTNFNRIQPNDEGASATTLITVAQINYKLHKDALNGKEWTIQELKTMFVPLGVAITPDHTMQPYNGDGVLHTVIQRSGLTDVYNMWMDSQNAKYPRKGDNLYFVFKPVELTSTEYGVKLAFHSDIKLKGFEAGVTARFKWEVQPWFTSAGIDPSPRDGLILEVAAGMVKGSNFPADNIWGDYVHVGRVDEVLSVQNMHDGGDLDVNKDYHKSIINLIRSRTGLVINLTARRNIPLHY